MNKDREARCPQERYHVSFDGTCTILGGGVFAVARCICPSISQEGTDLLYKSTSGRNCAKGGFNYYLLSRCRDSVHSFQRDCEQLRGGFFSILPDDASYLAAHQATGCLDSDTTVL
jgi:hypothetical protein